MQAGQVQVSQTARTNLEPTFPEIMAVDRTPIEVWESILRYTISVPVFFENDPLNSYSLGDFLRLYGDETQYWESERHRNILRRVCSSWNIYLQQFSHRYVNIEDVIKGHISSFALCGALRLKIKRRRTHAITNIIDRATLHRPQEWAVQILEGRHGNIYNWLLNGQVFSNIKVVIDYGGPSLPFSVKYSPTFLRIAREAEQNSPHAITFSRLTTLSLRYLPSLKILHNWEFPSLRHLNILMLSMDPAELVDALKVTGKGLKTLLDVSVPSDNKFPAEIWNLCPHLEVLQTSFIWEPGSTIPKTLRLLRIPLSDLWINATFDRLPVPALMAADVTTVGLDWRWSDAIWEYPLSVEYLCFAMEHGLTLVDEEEVPFDIFLVHILSFFWKRNGKKIPRMLQDVVNFVF